MTDKKIFAGKLSHLIEFVKNNINDTCIIPMCDMSERCTFRVGGKAALALVPSNIDSFTDMLAEIKKLGIPYKILGNGSNVLPPDPLYSGVIVYTTALSGVRSENSVIYAECGLPLSRLVRAYVEAGGVGSEELYGIPGTVGGGVFMNAGAYGREVKDILRCVHAYDASNCRRLVLYSDMLSMGYRTSVFQKDRDLIILAAEFDVHKGDTCASYAKMQTIAEKRRASQPLEYANAGSTFKRPEGHFAGKLIEDAGLKGRRVGGACVSLKHAGFIVNTGGATTADINALIDIVKTEVYDKFGVSLECEVEYFS